MSLWPPVWKVTGSAAMGRASMAAAQFCTRPRRRSKTRRGMQTE